MRLERSEVRYGLGPKTWPRSTVSIDALAPLSRNVALDIGLGFVRPKVAVDSLTLLAGSDRIIVRTPCSKAKRRSKCIAAYTRALINPTPYGYMTCGRCPVPRVPLALVYTRRDEARVVTDLKAFGSSHRRQCSAHGSRGVRRCARSSGGRRRGRRGRPAIGEPFVTTVLSAAMGHVVSQVVPKRHGSV